MAVPHVEDFYQRKAKMKVLVKGFADPWNVDFYGWDGEVDCQVGHFGYNQFFRTAAGLHRRRYKTFSGLTQGILTAAKNARYEIQRFDIEHSGKTLCIQL